jgi:hypothetical protein
MKVNGLYFNAIHDGRVLDEATGKLADVRMTRLFRVGIQVLQACWECLM